MYVHDVADAQGGKGLGTKNNMWVVSTPDPSRWAAWVAARHGGKNVGGRQRQGKIVGEKPALMQQGFTTGVVVGMLNANIPVTDDADRRGCLKQLVAKQGTVSKHFAVMVVLGAGLFFAQNLQELFGLPVGCAAGYGFVKDLHREISPRDRKSVRSCAVRCPFATASPEFPHDALINVEHMQAWASVMEVAKGLFGHDLPSMSNTEHMSPEQRRRDVMEIFVMCGSAIPPLPLLTRGHLAMCALNSLSGCKRVAELSDLFNGVTR